MLPREILVTRWAVIREFFAEAMDIGGRATPRELVPSPTHRLIHLLLLSHGDLCWQPTEPQRPTRRAACRHTPSWIQFVQLDQHKRRTSDIDSASHAEGRWFDPSRDHNLDAGQRPF